LWTPLVIDVATYASDKAYLSGTLSTGGPVFLVWDDMRSDDGDIYGQNINPDGTLGESGPTPTPGPSVTPTTPPEPTNTPAVPPSPTPEATATSEPTSNPPTPTATALPLGVRLDLPQMAHVGQNFYVTGYLDNPTTPLSQIPTFFFLEVAGEFWFWPSWVHFDPADSSSIDYSLENIPMGTTAITVVPEFDWPDTGDGTVNGLAFWGAMLNESMDAIIGDFARKEWGYGP
jgi:hypothetical protein